MHPLKKQTKNYSFFLYQYETQIMKYGGHIV